MSATELYRQHGFGNYQTAWAWLHKIRSAMVIPDRDKLKGAVEVDEAYVGGKGEIAGRGAKETQSVVVVAVEMLFTKKGFPASGRVGMRVIPDASAPSLVGFIQDHVEKGTTVITDDWKGYLPLCKYGYDHEAIKIGDPKEASVKFPRVHRVISNLKAWLNGTHRFASPKHIQNYLNEFVFRFNRRGNPQMAFRSLMQIAVKVKPPQYKRLVSERPGHQNGKSA
jgi:transposase-like protein